MGNSVLNLQRVKLILLALALGAVLLAAILPPSGRMALAEELCSVLGIWCAALYAVMEVLTAKPPETSVLRIARVIVVGGCLFLSLWFSKDLTQDLLAGPQPMTLYEPSVRSDQGDGGLLSWHAYLTGKDAAGQVHRIKIARSEASDLQRKAPDALEIEYYAHTDRLVSYRTEIP